MMFEKHRFEIWNISQHPYKHRLSDFGYFNSALPNVSNVQSALDYMVAVLYPNTQPNVPTPGDLPTGPGVPNVGDVTPSLNDYRVVDDDGDGRSAGYRYEQREGDVAAIWYKIFDVDWSTDAILAAVTDVTDDRYFFSKGKTDLDNLGVAVAGLYAGQKVYGGALINTNLTLNANAGDGVGLQTGFVQVDGAFRPTLDDTYDLSTATERWKDLFLSNSAIINTMTLVSGVITDSTGQISFDNENLITTGNITGSIVTGSSLVADDTVNTLTLVPGVITDSSGAISFGSANLVTTGTLGAGVTTLTANARTLIFNPDNTTEALITSSLGTISFDDENLITTGTFSAGVITGTQLNIDNLRLDGNTISSTDVNGAINLNPDGSGVVNIQKVLTTLSQNMTGILTITGSANVDNLTLNGNVISNNLANGDVVLSPSGTGVVSFTKNFIPAGSLDLGSSVALINDLFLSGGIRNATNEMAIADLLSLRSTPFRDLARTQPAQAGDALFWDAVNGVYLASVPDSEVDHTTISGLTTGDAGHTQFAMLAGRTGGQIIQGGTAASENLVLESTAHATKGLILFRDVIAPETDASFSGTWSGLDIGDATHNIRDVYSKGEFKGLRFENFTSITLPAASGQNIGRVVYATDNSKAYVDTGVAFKVLGVSKFILDTVWTGAEAVKNIDVSASIEDARNAQWQLMDNANNFEIMYVRITVTSVSNVRITTNVDLPAGSYRLIGVE